MPLVTGNANTNINGNEVSKLLTAAVVNTKFCRLLLSEPARALAVGFNGEKFHLSADERDRVLSIRARNLADFASQLIEKRNNSIVRLPVHLKTEKHVYVPVGLD